MIQQTGKQQVDWEEVSGEDLEVEISDSSSLSSFKMNSSGTGQATVNGETETNGETERFFTAMTVLHCAGLSLVETTIFQIICKFLSEKQTSQAKSRTSFLKDIKAADAYELMAQDQPRSDSTTAMVMIKPEILPIYVRTRQHLDKFPS